MVLDSFNDWTTVIGGEVKGKRSAENRTIVRSAKVDLEPIENLVSQCGLYKGRSVQPWVLHFRRGFGEVSSPNNRFSFTSPSVCGLRVSVYRLISDQRSLSDLILGHRRTR